MLLLLRAIADSQYLVGNRLHEQARDLDNHVGSIGQMSGVVHALQRSNHLPIVPEGNVDETAPFHKVVPLSKESEGHFQRRRFQQLMHSSDVGWLEEQICPLLLAFLLLYA